MKVLITALMTLMLLVSSPLGATECKVTVVDLHEKIMSTNGPTIKAKKLTSEQVSIFRYNYNNHPPASDFQFDTVFLYKRSDAKDYFYMVGVKGCAKHADPIPEKVLKNFMIDRRGTS